METKEYITLRVYKNTGNQLRYIYGVTGQSQISIIADAIDKVYSDIKQKEFDIHNDEERKYDDV